MSGNLSEFARSRTAVGDASPCAVRMSQVSFSYGESTVLADVNLDVNQGETCMIVGENGAGKSTLLKVMLGALAPATGSSELFGVPASSFRDWRRVGYVPQRIAGTYERFPATVREVVAANRYAVRKGFPPRSENDNAAVEQALDVVGMGRFSKRLIGELSGGQMQRVFLARALVNRPDLLVLDEPTSGMDVEAVESFASLLCDITAAKERSVVVVTHDTRRLSDLPARVLRLESGVFEEREESAPACRAGGFAQGA